MTCGIYAITNKKTGKMYIGQSIHIERRFIEHKSGKKDPTSHIASSIRKYGVDAFDFQILHRCSESELDSEERKFIKLYGTYIKGYNHTWGGEMNGMGHPSRNLSVRNKISQSLKGRKLSEEHKQSISNAHKGKTFSEQHKQNISKSKQGKNNYFYGKTFSDEHKQKISMSKNTTGYYRVSKHKKKDYKQGFSWRYMYRDENGKRKSIIDKNIENLRKRVIKRGLLWIDYSKVTLVEI